jgi:hypothetical protein
VAGFGLDAIVLRTPLRRAADPHPADPGLAAHGTALTLVLPYAAATLGPGQSVPLALAGEATLRELAAFGVAASRLPLLLTTTGAAGFPVRASLGPWSFAAQSTSMPSALQPLGLPEVLLVQPGQFPLQAMLPGTSVTLFRRAPDAPSLEALTAALETVQANAPVTGAGAGSVQTALPLLRELEALQTTWRGYGWALAVVLTVTVALVFGSAAILEYESTAFTTALLRSFGVGPGPIWCQRYLEAAFLANAGGAVALAAGAAVAKAVLPQFLPFLATLPVLAPVALALNLGALLAALPVAVALKRPVGLVLQ